MPPDEVAAMVGGVNPDLELLWLRDKRVEGAASLENLKRLEKEARSEVKQAKKTP